MGRCVILCYRFQWPSLVGTITSFWNTSISSFPSISSPPGHICYRQLGQAIWYTTWDLQILYLGSGIYFILLQPLQIEELQKYSWKQFTVFLILPPILLMIYLGPQLPQHLPKPLFRGSHIIIYINLDCRSFLSLNFAAIFFPTDTASDKD